MNKLIAILSFTLFLPLNVAFADEVSYTVRSPFVPVTIETSPDEVSYLGYLLDSNSQIVGVYYENPFDPNPADQLKTYSLESALKGVVLLQKSSSGRTYDLMRLQLSLPEGADANLTLNYLRNGLTGGRSYVTVGLRFNPGALAFEAYDLNSKKSILSAEVKIKYLAGQQVGIDRINFQYGN